LSALWPDIDLGFHVVQAMSDFERGVPNSLWRIRLTARYELHRRFSVYAGLTLVREVDRFPSPNCRAMDGVTKHASCRLWRPARRERARYALHTDL